MSFVGAENSWKHHIFQVNMEVDLHEDLREISLVFIYRLEPVKLRYIMLSRGVCARGGG